MTYNRMVVGMTTRSQADLVFGALADGTRREIVTLVLREHQSVSGLARRFPMSFAAVQKHVSVLERAGLVTKVRRGREQLVSGNIDAVRETHRLLDQLETLWRNRIDRIGELLADSSPPAEPSKPADPGQGVTP